MRTNAVSVDLVGELVVVEGGSVFRHGVGRAKLEGGVGEGVGARPGVHEGVQHHLGGFWAWSGRLGSKLGMTQGH